MSSLDADVLARAGCAAEALAPHAARTEREGRVAPEGVAAMVDAGLFKLLVPRELGGAECSVATFAAALERVARADASAGWCAMIGGTSGLMAAYLPDALAREVYAPADAVSCGVFAPTGRASHTAEGAVRVQGRWSFASGCEHSPWRMVGVMMLDGERPVARCVLLRAEETRVVPNWDVLGLRGTGSHDLAVDDVVVPRERLFSLLEPSRNPRALYRVAAFGVLAAGVAGVALGVAQGALDRFVALAREKTPMGAKRSLAHRELVQIAVARAEAKVRASRAMLYEAGDAVMAAEGDALEARAMLRLAACNAARESAAAVDLLYEAAGAGAARAGEPLQRMFRDVHVAAQHAMVADAVALLAGRVRLGVEVDGAAL